MSNLESLYDYYTSFGIKTGLSCKENEFTINNKSITIYSGALHYFRVHPSYWRDRLKKLRACGLNTVETYVPWNLHEPYKDVYDFGKGESDFSIFLDISKFLEIAKEEDLFVILRPGPYICAEWEFGGIPSYLLRNKNIKIRTSNVDFLERVEKYFKFLLEIVVPYQFTQGGPIIAFQVENEYGNVKENDQEIDVKYLLSLKNILEINGVVELLFTSDTPSLGFNGTIDDVLATANFQENAEEELTLLKNFQPGKPLMVMEFWSGWFDHWAEKHQLRCIEKFCSELEVILRKGASVNFYMFHGGTNWGFLNGANCFNDNYQADTTSYDYDAPLNESGDYTEKYFAAKELIKKYSKIPVNIPEMPVVSKKTAYSRIKPNCTLSLNQLLEQLNFFTKNEHLIPMEFVEKQNTGQKFGYILYRKKHVNIPPNATLRINGKIRDQAIILVNNVLKSKPLTSIDDLNAFGYWNLTENSLELKNPESISDATLDILVLNWGRVNFGKLKDFQQFKGLVDAEIKINDELVSDWLIYPLEFPASWNRNLTKWDTIKYPTGPHLYRAELIVDEPTDTFIDMRNWCQGIVVVNGFVLSRYCRLGPQQTAYLPAPFLKRGVNDILVFEHYAPAKFIEFADRSIYENMTSFEIAYVGDEA